LSRDRLEVGDRVGGYRLTDVLGSGGLGVVYRAEGAGGTAVALKALHPHLCEDELFVRRFGRELRNARRVRHAHLVGVLDGGRVGPHHYLVMPLIEGGTLAGRIRREGVLELADVTRIVGELAGALDALHAAGIVHRDVKPANVLLSSSAGSMLTDFGLAKGLADSVLSRTGTLTGTLDYVAPEIVRGQEATAAADTYSLAGLAYACLDGQPPFGSLPPSQLVTAHLEDLPSAPAIWRNDVPDAVGAAVLRALAKDTSARPAAASAFARQLESAAAHTD
jgi:serine/threonine protein kinase